MVRPKLNKIEADISKISIYLRSTKKFGKTTLWRDLIMEKFHDPTKGLLIACGSEQGYTMLDNLNAVHVTNYDELMELIDWLIAKKGIEHDIRMIAFDSVDEGFHIDALVYYKDKLVGARFSASRGQISFRKTS